MSFGIQMLSAALAGGVFGAILTLLIIRRKSRRAPDAYTGQSMQKEDILNAFEEGVLAIDDAQNLVYINRAAAEMLNLDGKTSVGKSLEEVLPGSTMGCVLRLGVPEYSIPIISEKNVPILSDRFPIREGDRVTGAAVLLRRRSETDRLAEDMTGVSHMVDAMRAYTHEFLNKLHVILGLIQLGETEKAEKYIMDVTSVHRASVGTITHCIGNPSVAALLVGKTSRCNELGMRLILRPESHLSADENLLPSEAYITILGNLIENSIEAMNQTSSRQKDITVSLIEDEASLLICVEDTGPGMKPHIARDIFQKSFSTKGAGRGTGLFLVREVTLAYQGNIRVESEPGVGTSFYITFTRNAKKETAHV